jgi:hypothetical protein
MSAPLPTTPAPKRGPGRPPKTDATPRLKRPQLRKSIPIVARAASPEARKRAAAILEVLGGMRTTTSAAEALGCSLPRYYHLEARALHGLLAACEPSKPGRAPSSAREVETLSKKCARLERELGRQLAIVRAAHRTIGLVPQPQAKQPKAKRGQRKRPVARALVAAELLRAEPAAPAAPLPHGSP